MQKLKKILIAFFALIFLILLAPLFIPKKVYINFVTNYLQNNYGTELSLTDASLRLLPNITVTLKGATVVKADMGLKLSAQVMSVSAGWVPLLIERRYSLAAAEFKHVNVDYRPQDYRPAGEAPLSFSDLYLKVSDVEIKNSNQLAVFDLKFVGKLPQLKNKELSLNGHFQYGLTDTKNLQIDSLKIGLDSLSAQVTGDAQTTGDTRFAINLEVASFAFKSFAEYLPKGAIVDGHGSMSVSAQGTSAAQSGDFKFASKDFSFHQKGQVDIKNQPLAISGKFTKNASVTNVSNGNFSLAGEQMSFGFNQAGLSTEASLGFDSLNLKKWIKLLPPLEALPPIDGASGRVAYKNGALEGNVGAKSIKLPDYDLTNVKTNFSYVNDVFSFDSLAANMLDGSIAGSGSMNLSSPKAAYDLNMQVKNMSMGKLPMLTGLVAGKGDFKFSGKGKGLAEKDWANNLDANGSVDLSPVKITALNVFEKIADSKAWDILDKFPNVIDKKGLAKLRNMDTTIDKIAGPYKIVNGLLETPDLSFNFAGGLLKLAGGIKLNQQLAYNGSLTVEKKILAGFIKDKRLLDTLANQKGKMILPLTVKGTTTAPVIEPDSDFLKSRFVAYASGQAKDKLLDKGKKVTDQLGKQLGDQIGNLFKK